MQRLWPLMLLCLGLAMAAPAAAQPAQLDRDQPVLLSADEVTYDERGTLVQAVGNVELAQGERILMADRMSYNTGTGLVTAQGNVTLLEPDGNVVFAEYVELDRDFTEGFITSIRLLMANNARMAANGARRYPDQRTVLAKAVYSPCDLCSYFGGEPVPLWQIKAVRVTHDKASQHVRYQDAVLEVMGFPVAYTPFFQHADPAVERKSGFLAPTFGSSSELGATVQIPYYWVIDSDRDLTFSPTFTTREGVVLAGEYRALTERGQYQLAGSLTRVDKRDINGERLDDKEFRGHIDGTGRFELSDVWRWGFDLQRATDDTYLTRYEISDADTLTSDIFVEGIRGRDYAAASAYAFQGLEQDDVQGNIPLVLPLLDYAWTADRTVFGGQVGLTANAVSLYRSEGADNRRLSLIGRWTRPFENDWGQLMRVTAQIRGDAYWSNDNPRPTDPQDPTDNDSGGRVHPLLAFDWRWPFVRRDGRVSQVIEPIVQLIAAPNVGNNSAFPNEDSQSLEFDDTNLFRLNRFPGNDRIEGGPRMNTGARWTALAPNGGYVTAIVGQVFRLQDDDTFATDTGLDKQSSDYVTSVTVAPWPFIEFTNRTRLDRDTLTLRRNEIYGAIGNQNLRLAGTYVQLDRELTADQLEAREELYLSLSGRLTRNFRFMADGRRDLTADGGMIRYGASLIYEDECIITGIAIERNFTRDRDVEPSTSVKFRIVLQTLG
jgi:LPS-assembly protein